MVEMEMTKGQVTNVVLTTVKIVFGAQHRLLHVWRIHFFLCLKKH